MSDLQILIDAARKWRDELHNYIIPDATDEDAPGYTAEADRISAAVEALEKDTSITVYFTGDEDGPDWFGLIYDEEDEARECVRENGGEVWRVPLLPLPGRAELMADEEDDGE